MANLARQQRRLNQQLDALASAAPQVMALRGQQSLAALLHVDPKIQSEWWRMGSEKIAAGQEAWWAMWFGSLAAQQRLGWAWMRLWSPLGVSFGYTPAHLFRAGRDAQAELLAVANSAVAPMRRRAVANARRLRKD